MTSGCESAMERMMEVQDAITEGDDEADVVSKAGCLA